jgi:hypothetical protein
MPSNRILTSPMWDSGQMSRPFASDRDWVFDVGPAELWSAMTEIESYPSWWPWLRRFDPGEGFEVGAAWRCEVAPPLPYVVRFTVVLDQIDAGSSARATVRGDVRGTAVLTVDDLGPDRSRARLRSRLEPAHPILRNVGRVARPMVEWGHDWVLDQGRRQFVERGLG